MKYCSTIAARASWLGLLGAVLLVSPAGGEEGEAAVEKAPAPATETEASEPEKPSLRLSFVDPRAGLQQWFAKGEEVEDVTWIGNTLLIINWMPAPNGDFDVYQVSGIEGYHSREHVERLLTEFYRLESLDEEREGASHVIVAGNNWGAGLGLKEILGKLSKAYQFDVFCVGGWAFLDVGLIEERAERKALIGKAHARAQAGSSETEPAKPQ